jgi:hypothetical protein
MTQQALRAGGDERRQDVRIYPEKLIATMRQFGVSGLAIPQLRLLCGRRVSSVPQRLNQPSGCQR